MSKIAVVYWSGTGNTEAMAKLVAEGAREAGAETEIFTADAFDGKMLDQYDGAAFGCPSMGSEELEDSVFEPMFAGCEPKLKGKKIALFGSYGWGDGEWMKNWEETCKNDGAELACGSVICQETPDEEAENACRELGKALT
ncbi:flavodoxin [Cuneatibacter sp. NSJ-177]|uniref:flavodoxin n=1 Tax=Cuneatibacter sp. NSJ-177 TaxID=2931401 RepID=UPI001FD3B86A|nr:flavodoxin [Cuneatibacter sp. NSJ-177]MCJ7837151.1 flavodoxin [Cuneatibacter sp. NSJ-177]